MTQVIPKRRLRPHQQRLDLLWAPQVDLLAATQASGSFAFTRLEPMGFLAFSPHPRGDTNAFASWWSLSRPALSLCRVCRPFRNPSRRVLSGRFLPGPFRMHLLRWFRALHQLQRHREVLRFRTIPLQHVRRFGCVHQLRWQRLVARISSAAKAFNPFSGWEMRNIQAARHFRTRSRLPRLSPCRWRAGVPARDDLFARIMHWTKRGYGFPPWGRSTASCPHLPGTRPPSFSAIETPR